MKVKKLIALGLCAAMVSGMTVSPVLAAEDTAEEAATEEAAAEEETTEDAAELKKRPQKTQQLRKKQQKNLQTQQAILLHSSKDLQLMKLMSSR